MPPRPSPAGLGRWAAAVALCATDIMAGEHEVVVGAGGSIQKGWWAATTRM
jgi:hypothetical protein